MPPPNQSEPGDDVQPSSAKPRKAGGCLFAAVLGGFIALVGGCGVSVVLLLISTIMRHSEAYRIAMQTAQASPCVVQRLGSPIKSGWFVSGAMRTVGSEGNADLDFSVSGPKSSGHMHVVATELDSTWSLRVLHVTVAGDRIDVVPVPSICE